MLTITIGAKYKFVLTSGRTVTVIVHGSSAPTGGGTAWDITVDGARGTYSDINQALGDSFSQVVLVA